MTKLQKLKAAYVDASFAAEAAAQAAIRSVNVAYKAAYKAEAAYVAEREKQKENSDD